MRSVGSVAARLPHDTEDVKEEVDDVQIEADGGRNVLFWGHLVHDTVSVEDDEEREKGRAHAGYTQVNQGTGEENLQRELDSLDIFIEIAKTAVYLLFSPSR